MKARGKLAYIQVDVGSSVFKDLANVTDSTISLSLAEIADSDADTGGWEEFLAGDKEATIDVTLNYTGAATQEIIHDAWLNSTTFAIKYGYRAYTSAFATTVKVNSLTIDAPQDGVRTMKATLRCTVIPTTTTASANLDSAGAYGKQRGNVAGLLVKVPTITASGTSGAAAVTFSATTGANLPLKVGQLIMFTGSEKVYTILTTTGSEAAGTTAITVSPNLNATLTTATIYAEVENRTTLSFSGNQGEIESTDANTAGFKEYLPGDSGMTITTTVHYDDKLKMIDTVINAYYNQTTLDSRWIYGVAATKNYYKSNLIVTKADMVSPQAGVQDVNLTLRVSTKPTTTAQA